MPAPLRRSAGEKFWTEPKREDARSSRRRSCYFDTVTQSTTANILGYKVTTSGSRLSLNIPSIYILQAILNNIYNSFRKSFNMVESPETRLVAVADCSPEEKFLINT